MKWLRGFLIGLAVLYFSICVGMYFFQEKLLFHPYALQADYKFPFKGRFDEINLDIANGCRVNALYFHADTPAKGVVLYFHGNAEALDYTGTKASTFISRGYDCIMVDYPGYGKSTGALTEENLFNTGIQFMNYAKRQYSSDNIVIYGRSLGTGIAAHTAREGAWFKALILEAPYYSIVDVAKGQYPYLPVGLLCRYPISTYQYLKDLQHPVYAIHGTEDEVIPISSPRKFLKLGLKQFHLTEIKGAAHGNLANFKEYDQVLDQVLN